MSEAMKMSSLSKNTSFRAATLEDIDVMISIIGDYYESLHLKEAPPVKGSAPWSLDVRQTSVIYYML